VYDGLTAFLVRPEQADAPGGEHVDRRAFVAFEKQKAPFGNRADTLRLGDLAKTVPRESPEKIGMCYEVSRVGHYSTLNY